MIRRFSALLSITKWAMPLLICFLLAVASSPALGQTVSMLHSFSGGTDGGYPAYETLVQGTDGNLYGTTTGNGTSSDGTIFRVTPDGALTTLYDFDGSNSFSAGGPAFPCFFLSVPTKWVPRSCVLRKGGYDAAGSTGSRGWAKSCVLVPRGQNKDLVRVATFNSTHQ
jgi:uncharacterized repeat protein (TIGR03803 family)